MQQYFLTSQAYFLADKPSPSTEPQWLRFDTAEAAQTQDFMATVKHLSGLSLQELHVQDAANPSHPSDYDGAEGYGRVVFRSLLAAANPHANSPNHANSNMVVPTSPYGNSVNASAMPIKNKKNRHKLAPIHTQALTFIIADTVLITVQESQQPHQHQHQHQIDLLTCLERLKHTSHTGGHSVSNAATASMGITPHQLLLRFVDMQVDAYLALRQPLTDQLDRWQRELLDPRRPFNDWTALLDARLELRKLEALSEEQMDAVSELREAWLETDAVPYDSKERDQLRVRLADIVDHVGRVLNHARRLESSVESAIQLHFAAVAHQTNHTVRNLTILTGVFAPLSLITGFYGMNVPLPWQQEPQAVWWVVLGMVLSAAGVLGSIFISRLFRQRADS